MLSHKWGKKSTPVNHYEGKYGKMNKYKPVKMLQKLRLEKELLGIPSVHIGTRSLWLGSAMASPPSQL